MGRKTAIDLFSGCGGLTVGLKKAGFKVLAAVEKDNLAASTYRLNHKAVKMVEEDIKNIDLESFSREIGVAPGQLDLIAGCPPCQGFSSLRTYNGGKQIDEPMNDLVFSFMDFVEYFSPRSVMLENVPGLLNDYRMVELKRRLVRLGYRPKAKVMDAQDYGVPQRRRRMILIAIKGRSPTFAKESKRKRTVKAAIGRLHIPGKGADVLHDYLEKRSERVQELIKAIRKDGGSRNELPESLQLDCHKRSDGFKDVYGRMAWSKPSPTITGGCINPSRGRFLHPEQNRAITLREAAMLQGFPSSYKFDIKRGKFPTAQLIGNAFPPLFASKHAEVLIKKL